MARRRRRGKNGGRGRDEAPEQQGRTDQHDLLEEDGDGPSRSESEGPPGTPSEDGESSSSPSEDSDSQLPLDPEGERLARARTLVEEGRVRDAIDVYRALVSDHPSNVRARNNLGVLYDELGSHELALEQFEAARELEPENVEVLTNLGASLGGVGRFEEAERELRRAQRLDPEALDVRANLGILYYRRGLYAQAEAELRWVCERDHDHGPAHFYRGEALNRLGRVDQAMDVLERAIHLQPENAKAFYTLGILFDKKHMPEEAARMYRKSRQLARP